MSIAAFIAVTLGSVLSGIVGGLTMAGIFASVLGLIVEFMYNGSLGLVKMVLSDQFLNFTNLFELLPYKNINWYAILLFVALIATIGFAAVGLLKSIAAADSREAESPVDAIKRIIITVFIVIIFMVIFFSKVGNDGATIFTKIMSIGKDFVNVGDKLDDVPMRIAAYVGKDGIAGYIFVCILGFMLTRGVVTASITFIERMVTLVILVTMGPLAIATNAARDTEAIFKSWLKAILGTMLAIILSLGLFRLFVDQMHTWSEYEKQELGLTTETVRVPWDGTEDQKNACLANGSVTIQKCESESGVSSGQYCKYITWSKAECEQGYKELPDTALATTATRDFLGTANTYRLILAIAWITLCGSSEKFINQLGLSSIANGEMARNFMQSARQAVGFIGSGYRTGYQIGSQAGRMAALKYGMAKDQNRQKVERAMANDRNDALKGNIGNLANMASTPAEFARQRANEYGKAMGKSMALNKMPINNDVMSQKIAGSGLFDSNGKLIKGEYRAGANGEGAQLCQTAKAAMQQSYNDTSASMSRIESAISKGKYTSGQTTGSDGTSRNTTLSSDLNTAFLNDAGFSAYENGMSIIQRGSGKDAYSTFEFNGRYTDGNGVSHELNDATFVNYDNAHRYETEMENNGGMMYASKQETAGGYVYYNSNEDEITNRTTGMARDMRTIRDETSAVSSSMENVNNKVEDILDYVAQEAYGITDEDRENADSIVDSISPDDIEEV